MARVPDSPWRPGVVGERAIWQRTTKLNLGEIRESCTGAGGGEQMDKWTSLLAWPVMEAGIRFLYPSCMPFPSQLLILLNPQEAAVCLCCRSCVGRTPSHLTPLTSPTSIKPSYSSACVYVGPQNPPRLCLCGGHNNHHVYSRLCIF